MKLIVLLILITCALGLYGVKYLFETYQNGTLKEKLEHAARKALRLAFRGLIAVGLACVAISMFPAVRVVGFAVLPTRVVASIRLLMQAIFETNSVYAALQIFASVALVVVEFSLIFSILGLFVTKTPVIPQALECNRMDRENGAERSTEIAIPRVFRKIFLNFANLRI